MSYIPDAISVVIPTYNRAHLIKASIQSVLDQTLQPYEIIVVDDFSTDNTEEVVNSFNSPLIKYVKNQRKKGANGARNTGILIAQGEYIAFHDSDDVCLRQKLEKQYQILSTIKETEICFCTLIKRYEKKENIFPYKKINTKNIMNLIKVHNWISTQTILIKKNLACEVMFDEDLHRFQDWDFILRCVNNKNTYHLHQPLVIQNISSDSITLKNDHLLAYEKIFEKYKDLSSFGIYNKVISNELKYKKNPKFIFYLYVIILKLIRKIDYLFRRL